MGARHGSDVATVVSAPIWVALLSAMIGVFETIALAAGVFATAVGEAVVCAAARFSRSRRFFSAFFKMALGFA
jgi:hypothetical protein